MSGPQASRMIILNAAAELVVELEQGGSVGVPTVGAVAERAGVSRMTIYRHFEDRDGLMAALEQTHGLASASTRERILSAVGRVLPGRSLSGITVEEVADEAGVAAVTVYRRFEDRNGLLRAFFQERGPRHDAAVLLSDTAGDPVETLVRFVTQLVQFIKAHRTLVLESLSPDEETQALLSEVRRGDKQTHKAVMRFMAAQIEQGRLTAPNPTEPALALFSLVLGFAAIMPLSEGVGLRPVVVDDRAVAERIVGIFWNGFGGGTSP